jgi:hypothetical protein
MTSRQYEAWKASGPILSDALEKATECGAFLLKFFFDRAWEMGAIPPKKIAAAVSRLTWNEAEQFMDVFLRAGWEVKDVPKLSLHGGCSFLPWFPPREFWPLRVQSTNEFGRYCTHPGEPPSPFFLTTLEAVYKCGHGRYFADVLQGLN